ncbi:TPM domain-containing protein [Konateibacter massiliensis]|uniref:TPM domain-containing protein n=1 Tax=Konateibacter massiliensis TaxID=2002841 RepID=UPI000C16273A|nr:TPM domain-containing protein [Konateibacter massiliensis]
MKRYIITFMTIFIFLFACGFQSPEQKVYDDADILSEEEEQSLNELCQNVTEEMQADFVIVTVDSLDGKTSTEYADDFFDYNGFGYEEEMGTGTILLVAMGDREIAFSTSGECIDLFSQNATDNIMDQVASHLGDEEYYDAMTTYVDLAKRYIDVGRRTAAENAVENGVEIAGEETAQDNTLTDWAIKIVAALVVGFVVVIIMYSGNKSKMTVNGYTYASGHKSQILRQHDVFQRTVTIKRKIQTNPPPGAGMGGSRPSTHIGSSGNRHGGGSRKF